jgi:predicted aspartyl protease
MKRWLGAPIVAMALVSTAGHAGEPSSLARLTSPHDGSGRAGVHRVDNEAAGCGTARLGETTVATLKNAPIVTLFANGAAITLLLDTGAEATILTPAVAQRIGARPPRIEFQRQMHGIGGSLQTGEVELRSFTIGGAAIAWKRVRVAPVNVTSVFSGPLDGVLGADTLSSFDIDLDLPGHRVVLYKKQTCSNAGPAWTEPYVTIPTGQSLNDRLFFPVRLDGRRLDTFVDTGAQLTVLSVKGAMALGLTEGVLARDPAGMVRGIAAEQLAARVHRFSRLEIGPEIIRNPEIIVTDVRLSDADLVLGIDLIRSRRIWLSYGSRQIFLMRR